jgi:hypothetical protein
MILELIPSKRGQKVILDDKHVKTIAKKYAMVYSNIHSKISLDKKRPTDSDRKLLKIQLLYKKWLEKLAISEPHIFSYIKNTYVVDLMNVIPLQGKQRFELQLSNGTKVKCPSLRIASLFPEKEPIYSNY